MRSHAVPRLFILAGRLLNRLQASKLRRGPRYLGNTPVPQCPFAQGSCRVPVAAQFFICTTFGSMVSAVTLSFTEDGSVRYTWLYFCSGLVLTVLALFGHAAGAGRTEDGSYEAMGAGAQWGAIGGLAIFVTLYIAPAASGWFQGLIPCVEVSFRLANWLVSFRLLRWAIGLYAAYLILNWVLLRCSVSAFGVGGLLSLLRRGKKTPEAPSAVDCEKEPVFPRAPPSDAVVATVKKARKTRRKFQKSERKGR